MDQIDQKLLNAFPHPAMIINKNRKVIACNTKAESVGAVVGDYCWKEFGKALCLSEEDKEIWRLNPGHPGIKCVFCDADLSMEKVTEVNNPTVSTPLGTFDTYWVALNEETFLHYAIDVTGLKKKEELLLSTSKRLRSVLDNLNVLVYVADLENYKLLYVNKYGRDLWGNIEGAVCWEALQSGQTGPCSFCTNDKLIDAEGNPCGVYVWEFQNTVTGQWFSCQDQVIYWDDGQLVRLEIAIDITDRKAAEQSLQESNERYRALYLNTPAMLHSIDRNEEIVSASEQWLSTMGFKREEVIGKHLTDFLTDDSRKLAKEEVFSEFFRHGFCRDIEYTFVKKNGDTMDALLSAIAEYDKEGHIVRSLAVVVDITEQKKLMKQHKRSSHLAALGTVAAGVAHEINNPINGIINYATLLNNKSDNIDLVKNCAQRICLEGERIAEITRKMLYYSKENTTEKSLTDIAAVAGTAIDLVSARIEQGGCDIEVLIEPDLPMLIVNPQEIIQVLINLIDNACDALREKALTAEEMILRLKVKCMDMGSDPVILIEVYDNGVGMDEEVLAKAKEAFFSTKPSAQGTGLGLSIVNDIVLDHDGFFDIESVKGEFTKATICLSAKYSQEHNNDLC